MSYHLPRVLSFLLTLLLISLTTASNTSLLSITNTTYTKPTHKCASKRFLRTDHRPYWSECYRAIRALPSTYESGTFHNIGFNDGYRLPMTEKFGHCRAQVQIAENTRTVGSWVLVVAALDQLNGLCQRIDAYGDERTGGWLLMEPERTIKVLLLGPKDGPFAVEGVGGFLLNGTDVE